MRSRRSGAPIDQSRSCGRAQPVSALRRDLRFKGIPDTVRHCAARPAERRPPHERHLPNRRVRAVGIASSTDTKDCRGAR